MLPRLLRRMPEVPNVWTDGSLVLDEVIGVSSFGSGFFAQQSAQCWRGRRWRHVDSECAVVGGVRVCRGFLSVPRRLQTVQRVSYGVSFWLCRLLVLCIWVLTI